jgi:hypothetical protein
MKRRNFIGLLGVSAGAAVVGVQADASATVKKTTFEGDNTELVADVVIAGAGLGGFAAALSSLKNNHTVVMTEETDWIGGQLTQQGVPPDEHQWIESHGATQLYRDFRNAIRDYYKRNYPLTERAVNGVFLNPGGGMVSKLCHEPKVALAVLNDMLMPYISSGKLVLLLEHKVVKADASGTKVQSLVVRSLRTKKYVTLIAPFFVDATELGDLLPLTGTAYVTGTESRTETKELHAPEKGDPENVQSFTACFAMDYVPDGNHVIDKPRNYDFWKNHVPVLTPAWSGKLIGLSYADPKTLQPKTLGFHPEGIDTDGRLNLWNYRKIINKDNFTTGFYKGDITLVNWPQNDYMLGNIIGVSDKDFNKHYDAAKQLSLSLLYWLQTEAPRPDGGKGFPGLRLRKDIMGTEDGLAKYPYIRESRRIKAVFTILEEHVGKENRLKVTEGAGAAKAADFYDSVGVGYYHIDLHPSCGGVNYVDFESLRFQIPLGALLPVKMENLLPANKNIGTTHITNGCYRLHPVEWSIGEAVGLLLSFARQKNVLPRQVRENTALLNDFQQFIGKRGIETKWK